MQTVQVAPCSGSSLLAHLVPVVVPAIGPGHDHHPVLPISWRLGGKRETEAEQGEED